MPPCAWALKVRRVDRSRAGYWPRIHRSRELAFEERKRSGSQTCHQRASVRRYECTHTGEHLLVGFRLSQHNFWNPFARLAVEVKSQIIALARIPLPRITSRSRLTHELLNIC
jgi:hypothetical protein